MSPHDSYSIFCLPGWNDSDVDTRRNKQRSPCRMPFNHSMRQEEKIRSNPNLLRSIQDNPFSPPNINNNNSKDRINPIHWMESNNRSLRWACSPENLVTYLCLRRFYCLKGKKNFLFKKSKCDFFCLGSVETIPFTIHPDRKCGFVKRIYATVLVFFEFDITYYSMFI